MNRAYRCLFIAVLCGSATTAAAQNLLQNGTFDTQVAPWVAFVSTATFSSLDAFGNAASGSLRGTNAASGMFSGELLLSECIPVVGGTLYERRYDYRIEPVNGLTVFVHPQIIWYADSTCREGSAIIGEGGRAGNEADGAWHPSPDPVDQFLAPPAARGARLQLIIGKVEAGGSVTANFDNVVFKASGTCAPLPEVLCLNQERFQVEALWRTSTGSGRARVVKLTNDTGYLWFFGPDNVEVVIKVLNACNPFNSFWVFAGGLTDVEVEIFVTDTKTGRVKVYRNDLGEPFAPLQDTGAFATCP
jgi:hypothetical protein